MTGAGTVPFTGTTSNALDVTKGAQGQFAEAVSYLEQVVTNILDSSQQLTTAAMVSQAGAKFGSVVGLWAEKAGDILNNLEEMVQFLGFQIQALEQNEDNNTALAAALGNLNPPSF
jgi:hypothetical protein